MGRDGGGRFKVQSSDFFISGSNANLIICFKKET